jgi:hypothetical protein
MKLKLGADFDAEGLDEADYDDTEFPSYDGPLPPNNTWLTMRLTKAWQRYSSNSDLQFKTILVAGGGDYDGLTIWDNITFTEKAAFHYRPWLLAFGITAKMIKSSTVVDDDEGKFGHLVQRIGRWTPDTDDALCRVRVVRGKDQEDNPRPEAGTYRPLEDDDEGDRDEAPAPRRRAQALSGGGAGKTAARSKPAPPAEDDDDLFGEDENKPPF